MLSEEQIEALGDKIVPLYQELEQNIIGDIARRVKKTGRYTETAELMVQSMVRKGYSADKIRVEVMKTLRADKKYQDFVANNTLEYKKMVSEEIKRVEKEAKDNGDEIMANAGDMSYNTDLSMWGQAGKKLTKDSAFTHLVKGMQDHTSGTLKNLTKTTGFQFSTGFASANNAYTNILDKSLIKLTSGAFSFDQCVNDAVREMAQSGFRTVDYSSGRSYQIDSAARMCVRTATSQLSAKMVEKHCDDMSEDLVEVSEHWGARPEHALWQGKIYSRSGKSKRYPDFSICGYGTVEGLCGANCRHTFFPFFEGTSEPTTWEKEPAPSIYNGKEYDYYHATQKQRIMERNIRATRREIEAMNALQGNTKALSSKLKQQIAEYHQFSRMVGIKAKDNRIQVISNTSNISKTKTKRYYDSLVKSNSSDIIKLENHEKVIGNDSFRIPESKFYKAEFKDISALKYSLPDLEVRKWYKNKDSNIINIIDKLKPLENQAREAFELRNMYRTQARDLMLNHEERKKLDNEHPNKSFEEFIQDKMKRKSLAREEALRDTIQTSGKTNKKVDTSLGLE